MPRKLPLVLLLAYAAYFAVLAINPYDRAVWVAEMIPVVLVVLALALLYPRFRFSNTSYVLMSFFIFLHTLGGHYTFERVPFGFVSDVFGFERNHFDRIAHFSVGFFAYPIAEYLERRKLASSRTLMVLFGTFAIFTVASVYEIIEWWYAASAAPEQGVAFLGSQGDIWDAQKDMLADGLGAVTASLLFLVLRRGAAPERETSADKAPGRVS